MTSAGDSMVGQACGGKAPPGGCAGGEGGRVGAEEATGAAVGATVRARSDRLPSIVGGGARRLNQLSGKPRLSEVFFGAEYGGQGRKTTMQFRPHRQKNSYWFWPQIREDQELMLQRWTEAIDRALKALARARVPACPTTAGSVTISA